MSRLIHYFAHPGVHSSIANIQMWKTTADMAGVSRVDLYAEYPRAHIDVELEQERLRSHQVVLLQFPIFWYSSPSLVKEWIDLTLERGFAYGEGGDALAGKTLQLAVTAGGDLSAYCAEGYQRFPLRTFLTPFEQTARICGMRFAAPYVLFGSLATDPTKHVEGFYTLVRSAVDDHYDFDAAIDMEFVQHDTLPLREVTN